MKMNKFEWLKWKRNKKNIFILCTVLIAVICYFFILQKNLAADKAELKEATSTQYLELYQAAGLSEDQEVVELYQDAMDSLNEYWVLSYTSRWEKSLQNYNNYLKNLIALEAKMQAIPILDYNKNEQIKTNTYYLKQKIRPENEVFGISGIYFSVAIAKLIGSLIGAGIICFLFFDLFTNELENSTIKLLDTMPIKKERFIQIKKRLSYKIISLTVFVSLLLAFLVGSIGTKRMGSLNSVISMVIKDDVIHSLFAWQFLALLLLLFTFLVYFIINFIHIISIYSKKTEIVLYGSLGLFVMLPLFFSKISETYKWVYLIPFNQINLSELLIQSYKNNHLAAYLCSFIVTLGLTNFILLIIKKGVK